MSGQGDVGIGIGRLYLHVVPGGLEQLDGRTAHTQSGICHHIAAYVLVVGAGVGDDDFVATLERNYFKARTRIPVVGL